MTRSGSRNMTCHAASRLGLSSKAITATAGSFDMIFAGSSSVRTSSAPRPPMPKVSGVDFVGGGPFSPADLEKQFKIRTGQRPSAAKLRNSSEKLSRFLMEKGYLEPGSTSIATITARI